MSNVILLITALTFVESQLLTPDVFESPELYLCLLRIILVMPSVVFDSDSDRICLTLLLCSICDGNVPAGSVLDRGVDVDIFADSSWI